MLADDFYQIEEVWPAKGGGGREFKPGVELLGFFDYDRRVYNI